MSGLDEEIAALEGLFSTHPQYVARAALDTLRRLAPQAQAPEPQGGELTEDEIAALVEALRYDRCEYGCAITYTTEAVKYDLAPIVERIIAARKTQGGVTTSDTTEDGVAFIRRLVGAWDCCATCAGGVLAEHDRRVLAERDGAADREVSGPGRGAAEDDRGGGVRVPVVPAQPSTEEGS